MFKLFIFLATCSFYFFAAQPCKGQFSVGLKYYGGYKYNVNNSTNYITDSIVQYNTNKYIRSPDIRILTNYSLNAQKHIIIQLNIGYNTTFSKNTDTQFYDKILPTGSYSSNTQSRYSTISGNIFLGRIFNMSQLQIIPKAGIQFSFLGIEHSNNTFKYYDLYNNVLKVRTIDKTSPKGKTISPNIGSEFNLTIFKKLILGMDLSVYYNMAFQKGVINQYLKDEYPQTGVITVNNFSQQINLFTTSFSLQPAVAIIYRIGKSK